MLEARRFQLKDNPDAFSLRHRGVGPLVASFKKSWQALYALAGLDWGRAKGLTWHTTRHEFISRVAETTKNPKDAQEAARHKRLETTQRYMHTRRNRRWEVAHGLNR
jgi:integrase